MSATRNATQGGKKNLTRATKSIPLTPLTTAEVRRLPKPHTGFESFVEPLAEMVEANPTEFGSGIDVDQMRADLASYRALEPQREALAAQLALIDDTRIKLGSSVWVQELLIYDRALSAARTNPAVLHAIEPFERSMRNKPHKKATVSTTPTPTT